MTEQISRATIKPLSEEQSVTEGILDSEEWREYEFRDENSCPVVYRITEPRRLYTRCGAKTHRVLDAEGVVHCVPTPGERGCVLRWKPKDAWLRQR